MTWGAPHKNAVARSNRATHGVVAPRRHGRAIALVGVVGVVAAVATGCTSAAPAGATPTRVLQTVETSLSSDGSITAVDSTAISVDDSTGTSTSATTVHTPSDVADALPIRVTTSYRTADGSGSDLADLEGHDGRVEIDLTVENLTVAPQQLTHDAAGTARAGPARVGAPRSAAAAPVLPGGSPSAVVPDSAAGGATPDGIVSADASGDAVVQWGALLAPPRSGASTPLPLVVDADDLAAPTFDLAAQAGLSTDLSVDGVLASAFDSSPTSDLALQQRTIDLVSDVNLVLSRAGETITEVRTNLVSTSDTLGVRTAEQLRDSSSSLASTMQGLTGQLTSLESDLGSTVTSTQSTVRSQLQTTVASVDSLLGDTTATAPTVTLDGEGCATVVAPPAQASSVYGSLLQVSAQLDGYAQSNEACRDEVAAALDRTVGPAEPDLESCVDQQSLTCSLFASSYLVTDALIGLVDQGTDLADSLQPELAQNAIDRYTDLEANLTAIQTELSGLATDPSRADVATSLAALDTAVESVATGAGTVRGQVSDLHDRASRARQQIGDADTLGSMQAQNAEIADELCEVVRADGDETGLSLDQVERLRSYLTDQGCPVADDGSGEPAPEPATLRPPFPYSQPMDARLADQAAAWDAVVTATDTRDTTQGLGASLTALDERIQTLRDAVDDVHDAVEGNDGSVGGSVDRLRAETDAALTDGARLLDRLNDVKTQQDTLAAQVQDAFENAGSEADEQVKAVVGQQVRVVSEQGAISRQTVVDAFDRSIAGLESTSDVVMGDSKATIEQQRGALGEQTDGLTAALDQQTVASLERIGQSTASSTRDVEGARTLLAADLAAVLLDLGDREVDGSGILGAMATSAAKADTADYQLALASKNASGYANVRADDIAGIMLRQAQFTASVEAAASLPAFHLDVPSGATSTTLYAFTIGATR
ncbi:hypothetical protein [Frigoribacterium sp. RIT-PI-h]|uniref:hypothetical protein n=1 Tax=Frigoribacterium sp. RIT-PI-h TaxID=1690245 RepID=UPI0006B8C07C|nr:hypothetical protein [Frigoribacterium sp. RIT-PI-h]